MLVKRNEMIQRSLAKIPEGGRVDGCGVMAGLARASSIRAPRRALPRMRA